MSFKQQKVLYSHELSISSRFSWLESCVDITVSVEYNYVYNVNECLKSVARITFTDFTIFFFWGWVLRHIFASYSSADPCILSSFGVYDSVSRLQGLSICYYLYIWTAFLFMWWRKKFIHFGSIESSPT